MSNRLYQFTGFAIIILAYLGISAIFQSRMFCPKAERIQEKTIDLPLSRSTVRIDEDVLEYAVNSSDWAEYHNHTIRAKEGAEDQFSSRVNRNDLARIISDANQNLFSFQGNALELKSRKNGYILVPTWVIYEFNQFLPYEQ